MLSLSRGFEQIFHVMKIRGGYRMLGARIREIRQRNKFTLEYTARHVCSVGMLSRVERGIATPSLTLLNKLCIRLGVSVSEVVNDLADSQSDDIRGLIDNILDLIAMREYAEAITFSKEILRLKIMVSDSSAQCKCLHLMGIAYSRQGKYAEAHSVMKNSLELSVKIENNLLQATCLNAYGATLANLRKKLEAK